MEAHHFLTNVICRNYQNYGVREDDYTDLPRPYHTFAYVISGRLECTVGERLVVGEPGDVLFIPFHVRYLLRWIGEPAATYSFHFLLPPDVDPFADQVAPLQVLKDTGTGEEFAFIYRNIRHRDRALGGLSRFYGLCDRLFRQMAHAEMPSMDEWVRRAIHYIHVYYHRPLSVEALAAVAQMSPSRFYTLFKKETGHSPIVYKNRVAVQQAVLLLARDYSIEEVSAETGFASSAYFRRVFKAVTGQTPRQYRKTMAERF